MKVNLIKAARFILFAVFLFGIFTIKTTAQTPQKHRLVFEKCTGDWCPHCPLAKPVFEGLKEKYGDDVVLLSYSGANGDVRATKTGDNFIAKAGFGGFPTTFLSRYVFNDGKGGLIRALGFSSDATGTINYFSSIMEQIWQNEPDAKINLDIESYSYDAATKLVKAKIVCRFNVNLPSKVKLNNGTTTSMNYYVTAISKEDGMNYQQADAHAVPNSNIHDEVVRGMFPNEYGFQLKIPASAIVKDEVQAGTVVSADFSFNPNIVNLKNGHIAFLINDNYIVNGSPSWNTVIQAQEVPLESKILPAYDLVANETSRTADANTEQIITFTLKNLQTAPVTVNVTPSEMTFPTAPGWNAKLSFGSTYNDLSVGQPLSKQLQPNETATCSLKVTVGNTPASKATIKLDFASPQGNPAVTKEFTINVNAAPPAFEFSNSATDKPGKPAEIVEYKASAKNLRQTPISMVLKVLSVQKPSADWGAEICIGADCNDASDGQKVTKTLQPGESIDYVVKVKTGATKGEKALVKLNITSPDGDPDKDVLFTTTALGPAFTMNSPVTKRGISPGANALFDANIQNNYSSQIKVKYTVSKINFPTGWKVLVGTDGFYEKADEGFNQQLTLNSNESAKLGIKVTTTDAPNESGSVTIKCETLDGLLSYEEVYKISTGDAGVTAEEVSTGGVVFKQNYPNPAKTNTQFEVVLPSNLKVSLTVLDQSGKQVLTVDEANLPMGKNSINVDVTNLPSGTYNVVLQAGENKLYRNMNVVK